MKVNFKAMSPTTKEESIIAEKLNTLISVFGARAVVHGDGDDYSSMDIDICADINGKPTRICRLDVETKPQKYSFDECYPYAHPDWIPKHTSDKRGWSFLYRKVAKMYKDPRGRELVDKDDLYILCDRTCNKLFVVKFGDILANCDLAIFNADDPKFWFYRYRAVNKVIPDFIHTGKDGGYSFIVNYIHNKIDKIKGILDA